MNFVCFGMSVVDASWLAPEAKLVNKVSTKKTLKVFVGLHFSATYFKEIIKINCVHHKILNNFSYMTNNSEKCWCYHNVEVR